MMHRDWWRSAVFTELIFFCFFCSIPFFVWLVFRPDVTSNTIVVMTVAYILARLTQVVVDRHKEARNERNNRRNIY